VRKSKPATTCGPTVVKIRQNEKEDQVTKFERETATERSEARAKDDETRAAVSEAYTRAVASQSGCCCGDVTPKGVTAKLAGYRAGDIATLPADAVENSFGCGNPLAFADVDEGDVVLDLGSGAGIDLLLAARKVGPAGRVIGVDMTDVMIERARVNAAAAGFDTIEVRKGIIEDLPVDTASVDVLISNCVINLSPEKERVFAEIARVLKPGGRMRVSDIVVEELPEWVRESPELYSSCIAGAISEDAYIAGLEAAGLEQVEVADRLVYDSGQLEALAGSEIVETVGEASGCCGGGPTTLPEGMTASRAVAELEGKVRSDIFVARKPA
jgi:SAM-dependent methyltransferase